MERTMQKLRLFIDTHDKANNSFPDGLTAEQFEPVLEKYEAACCEEGVILLRVHLGYTDGRAFCLTMAPDAEAVRRAHARIGLPIDTITEVETASPTDTLFRRQAVA
jgi:hypothetical protein